MHLGGGGGWGTESNDPVSIQTEISSSNSNLTFNSIQAKQGLKSAWTENSRCNHPLNQRVNQLLLLHHFEEFSASQSTAV